MPGREPFSAAQFDVIQKIFYIIDTQEQSLILTIFYIGYSDFPMESIIFTSNTRMNSMNSWKISCLKMEILIEWKKKGNYYQIYQYINHGIIYSFRLTIKWLRIICIWKSKVKKYVISRCWSFGRRLRLRRLHFWFPTTWNYFLAYVQLIRIPVLCPLRNVKGNIESVL